MSTYIISSDGLTAKEKATMEKPSDYFEDANNATVLRGSHKQYAKLFESLPTIILSEEAKRVFKPLEEVPEDKWRIVTEVLLSYGQGSNWVELDSVDRSNFDPGYLQSCDKRKVAYPIVEDKKDDVQKETNESWVRNQLSPVLNAFALMDLPDCPQDLIDREIVKAFDCLERIVHRLPENPSASPLSPVADKSGEDGEALAFALTKLDNIRVYYADNDAGGKTMCYKYDDIVDLLSQVLPASTQQSSTIGGEELAKEYADKVEIDHLRNALEYIASYPTTSEKMPKSSREMMDIFITKSRKTLSTLSGYSSKSDGVRH